MPTFAQSSTDTYAAVFSADFFGAQERHPFFMGAIFFLKSRARRSRSDVAMILSAPCRQPPDTCNERTNMCTWATTVATHLGTMSTELVQFHVRHMPVRPLSYPTSLCGSANGRVSCSVRSHPAPHFALAPPTPLIPNYQNSVKCSPVQGVRL